MANFNMNPYSGTQLTPAVLPGADKGYGGRIISLTATLTMAAQASGSTLTCFKANAGWLFLGGFLLTNTSLSTATLALGGTFGGANTFQAALYSAAAVLTTVDKPQLFFNNSAASPQVITDPLTPYSGPETFILTTAVAALPASGILSVVANFMIS